MKRFAMAAVLSFLAVPVLALAEEGVAAVDRPAPMFRLPVYNAQPVGATVVGLDRYVGADAVEKDVKVVLLSFMASFCAPCKKEMPYLQLLHERYKDFGLRVVSVSIDTEPDGQKVIQELIDQNKITYPVLKDRFNLVARRWLGNQSPLPSVFLVRPDSTVSMVHRGYNQDIGTVLAAEIESALGIKRLGAPPMPPPAAEGSDHGAVAPAAGGDGAAGTTPAGAQGGKPVKGDRSPQKPARKARPAPQAP